MIDIKSEAEIICSILEDKGYSVINVETGKEALDILEEKTINLAIVEFWLNNEDGMEVFERIKEQRPELPVVIMSGHINIEAAVTAIKKGAADFLEKPLSLAKLLNTVEEILAKD